MEVLTSGDLFDALLDIVWFGNYNEVRIGIVGSHGAEPCIRIGGNIYRVDSDEDRRILIEYARRLRTREANAPIEPLPESTG